MRHQYGLQAWSTAVNGAVYIIRITKGKHPLQDMLTNDEWYIYWIKERSIAEGAPISAIADHCNIRT
jgi:hypothetical protein